MSTRPLALACSFLIAASASAKEPPVAPKPEIVNMWNGNIPAEKGKVGEETEQPQRPGQRKVKRITNVTKPILKVYRPAEHKNTGTAVVIAPGGGYHILAWDLEGEEVADWLTSIGVTGIVLKYRVPRRSGEDRKAAPAAALQDAQRAIRYVRANAKTWDIAPDRIGMLGFSAGGHLTAWTATNYDKQTYEPIDSIDKQSARPDFAVLVYPAYLVERGKTELKPDIRVTKDTPPTFFAHAGNDPVSPENSVAMYLALRRAGVPSELHIYSTGGHGFGLRPSKDPVSTWPKRCEGWLRSLRSLRKK